MTKYEPLEIFLRALATNAKEITLSFAKVASILGLSLPESAFTHRPWWANQNGNDSHSQAKAWISAGFMVESFDQSRSTGKVRFVRK